MSNLYKFLTFLLFFEFISSFKFCPNSRPTPQPIEVDTSKKINPVAFNSKNYTTIQVGNHIFLNDNTANFIYSATSGLYSDSTFCPADFKIPIKSDYESLLAELGSNAYTVMTNP